MMDKNLLSKLTNEIMDQGYDEATASRYAVLIGDTPTIDKEGNMLVMDGQRLVATLKPLKFFSPN